MITSQELYKKFLLKVNKNDTNTNIKVPKAQFVLIYNEEKRKWLDSIVKQNESSDYIEEIEELLEVDKELVKLNEDSLKVNFKLPTNFARRVSGYSVASRGDCKNNMLTNWFVKPKDKDVLLGNSDHNPSFDYQETLAMLNNGKVSVYKTDFNVEKAFLTYYREPIDIDIQGFKHIDGTASTNINTDLSTGNAELIVDRTVTEALRNYQSAEQTQTALQRQVANKNI